MTRIQALPHAKLEALDAQRVEAFLRDDVLAHAEDADDDLRVQAPQAWLLAHLREGVCWGVRDANGPWRLACSWFDEIPAPDVEHLQQLRVFGPERETLVWRDGDGRLRGRVLSDGCAPPTGWDPFDVESSARAPWAGADPLEPLNQRYLLIAGEESRANGARHERGPFTRLEDGTGAAHVVPLRGLDGTDLSAFPPALHARHHLAREQESGVVRVAATRLVALGTTRAAGTCP